MLWFRFISLKHTWIIEGHVGISQYESI